MKNRGNIVAFFSHKFRITTKNCNGINTKLFRKLIKTSPRSLRTATQNGQRLSNARLPSTLPTACLSQGGGPPSRGSSADADDRSPPPPLPQSPYLQPPDTKLFTPSNTYNFIPALSEHSLAGKCVFIFYLPRAVPFNVLSCKLLIVETHCLRGPFCEVSVGGAKL